MITGIDAVGLRIVPFDIPDTGIVFMLGICVDEIHIYSADQNASSHTEVGIVTEGTGLSYGNTSFQPLYVKREIKQMDFGPNATSGPGILRYCRRQITEDQ